MLTKCVSVVPLKTGRLGFWVPPPPRGGWVTPLRACEVGEKVRHPVVCLLPKVDRSSIGLLRLVHGKAPVLAGLGIGSS